MPPLPKLDYNCKDPGFFGSIYDKKDEFVIGSVVFLSLANSFAINIQIDENESEEENPADDEENPADDGPNPLYVGNINSYYNANTIISFGLSTFWSEPNLFSSSFVEVLLANY